MNLTASIPTDTVFNYANRSLTIKDVGSEPQNAALPAARSNLAAGNKAEDMLAAPPVMGQESALYIPNNAPVNTQDNNYIYENFKKNLAQGAVSGVVMGAVYTATGNLPTAAIVANAVRCAYSSWDTSTQYTTEKPAQTLSGQQGHWLLEGAGTTVAFGSMALGHTLSYYALRRLHLLRV